MKKIFVREYKMVGLVIGKWMIGLDWGERPRGWKVIFFIFDMESDDDIFRLG